MSFDCYPFRPSLKCTRCPTECRTQALKKKGAGARAARSIRKPMRTRRAMNRLMRKKSTRLLTGRGGPSTLMTRQALRTWWLRQSGSLRSTLGRLPRRRLRRLQSNLRSRRPQHQKCQKPSPPNCQKRCPGSK
ncbi:hypothetical protein VPH35_067025 [Triticum aestivum]